jgi:hypothetical protein
MTRETFDFRVDLLAESPRLLHVRALDILGLGWDPTITFWRCDRRVHFYCGVLLDVPLGAVAVEVAKVGPPREVFLGQVGALDEAWDILETFLYEEKAVQELPEARWRLVEHSHDRHIPHPPDSNPAANIARLFKP